MAEELKEFSQGENFSCRNCGASFTVYPIRSKYKKAMLDQCIYGCSHPEKIKCSKCNMRITVFWCVGH